MAKTILVAAALIILGAVAYSQNQAEEKTVEKKEPAVNAQDSATTASSLQRTGDAPVDPDAPGVDPEKIDWKKVDWRSRLTPEEFEITRMAGTERAFTGKYWKLFDSGQYNCGNCGLPLFESTNKFDAHCGWPSFDETIAKDAVVELEDNSHFMRRVEVRCRRCDAHLGHVFDDGPTKTGLRYCMNSASLDFVPAKDALTSDAKASAVEQAEPAAEKAAETKPAETPTVDP